MPGSSSIRRIRPVGSTGSTGSTGVLDCTRLPDDGHLDLAGIFELLLDLSCDLVREHRRRVVVDRPRRDHHANLPAGLHRVDLVDALVPGRDVLEVPQALDVLLERLAASAGTRPR